MSPRQIRRLGSHGIWLKAKEHFGPVKKAGEEVELGGNVTLRRDTGPENKIYYISHTYKAPDGKRVNIDEWQCSTRRIMKGPK